MDNIVMDVKIECEAGYAEALKGLSFNYKINKDMTDVAIKLSSKDFGHNKFLESIYLWVNVNAPRYWWVEADTYRLATKQSQSTMHTLLKDMEGDISNSFEIPVNNDTLNDINDAVKRKDLLKLKRVLPEHFLQRRMWVFNYKTLRNIIIQRNNHKLPHWKIFLGAIAQQIEHTDLLPLDEYRDNFLPTYSEYLNRGKA